MSKRYIISNTSDKEFRFINLGHFPYGQTNDLTFVLRLIGYYDELSQMGRASEILQFSPEYYKKFCYENRGICVIKNMMNEHRLTMPISRNMFIHLSRKWRPSPVFISKYAGEIIEAIFQYISDNPYLRQACKNLFKRQHNIITQMMPIQSEFLDVRRNNDSAGQRELAGNILLKINDVQCQLVNKL